MRQGAIYMEILRETSVMLGRWTAAVVLAMVALCEDSHSQTMFASVPWNSPLAGHIMNIVCPMQDDYLERKDLSALQLPAWLRNHKDPVGRCPVRYYPITDSKRIWPQVLIAVVCVCERSRCTAHGSHVCITVYVAKRVLKHKIGYTTELLSVDCICATMTAKLAKFHRPILVS